MTKEADIHIALMDRVQTMAADLVIPVIWPRKDTSDLAVEHVRAMHLPADNFPIDLSSDAYERQGILQLMHVTDLNGYEVVSRNRCGEIAAFFPRGLELTSNSVTLKIRATSILQGIQVDAAWETPIRVQYWSIS